jgi:peroxiredoxin
VSDESGVWAKSFGVKSTFGLYARVSFLVDRGGRIKKVYEDVDPAQHADEVLRDAQ